MRLEHRLPGRQGRLLVAYLALHRERPVTRELLMTALWGDEAGPDHARSLSVVVSKARRALGPDVLVDADEHSLALCEAADIDLERVVRALDAAAAATAAGDWRTAARTAAEADVLAAGGLLPGYEAPWLDGPRRRLEEAGLRSQELRIEAALELGPAELPGAERSARELVERAGFRESGHLLLMRAHERRGNVAEALRVYDELRVLLREELGIAPGPRPQAEFARLLKLEHGASQAAPPPAAGRSFFATRSAAAFVGRRAELQRFEELFQRSAQGARQVALLEGEPGIGKTRLALQVMAACEAKGGLALYGRCDTESLVPYQPFVEALRRYAERTPSPRLPALAGRHGAELARVVPELAPADGEQPSRGEGDDVERWRLFEAVSDVLTQIALAQPVALVLDDLHWADTPTLLMLRHLVRLTDQAPLLIVAGCRSTERPAALVDALAQLRREHAYERVSLTGLDRDAAAAMVAELGGPALSERAGRALWEETRGNPFFLEELLHQLGGEQPGDADLSLRSGRVLPEGIREAVGGRLATLSPATNRALARAAVIGREFSFELLAAVTGADEDALDDVIEEAVEAEVIAELPGGYGRCCFTHSLIRQTLYDSLTATRRARMHLRIAEALEAEDDASGRLAELAHHFSSAPPRQGAAKAVTYAESAARSAAHMLAYEEAARLYGMALDALDRLDGDPRRRCELLLRRGAAQTRAGDADARATFRAAGDAARGLGWAQGLAQAALGYGAAAPMAGGVVDATVLALLEESLLALSTGDSALRARLLARLAVELSFSESRDRRAALSSEAVEIARRVGDTGSLGYALMARHWSLWGPQNIDERLATANDLFRLASASGDERLAIQAHRYRMLDLLELGDIGGVDEQIEAYARLAGQQRRPGDLWYAQLFRAMRRLLAGRFDEVEAISADAYRTGRRVGDPNASQAHVLQAVALRRELGGLQEVRGAVEEQMLSFPAIPGWRCVLAHVDAELGRHDEARATLDDFAGDGFRALPHDGLWLGAVALLAETAAMLGDARHAARLYELLLPYGDRNVVIGWASSCAGSAARYLGLLAGLLGRPDDAAAHYDEALEMNEQMDAQPWVARTLLDRAELLLGLPEGHAEAATYLERAAGQAHELGMTRLTARIEHIRAHRVPARVLVSTRRGSRR